MFGYVVGLIQLNRLSAKLFQHPLKLRFLWRISKPQGTLLWAMQCKEWPGKGGSNPGVE